VRREPRGHLICESCGDWCSTSAGAPIPGEEVAADVIDGPNLVVFDQAENRLHVQKALILTLLGL
jgi:ornithine carbamoyltransferase